MDIKNRISKIQPYFSTFNVTEGSDKNMFAYVVVNFPSEWSLLSEKALSRNYKVNLKKTEKGLYFITDINNGTDNIFDAIDHIIDFNKELEAKAQLYKKKVSELKDIFAEEPLTKLKTLTFTFDDTPNIELPELLPKKGKKTEIKIEPAVPIDEAEEIKESTEETVEETAPAAEPDSLMAMAQEMTGE